MQVNRVAQVLLHAIWVQYQWEKMYSQLDCAYRYNISGSNSEIKLTMVVSIMRMLNQRLLSLLDNDHTNSLTYRPFWTPLNQAKTPFDA